MTTVKYDFPRETAVAINSGQATSIVIQGNIYDLFFINKDNDETGDYVALIEFLSARWNIPGVILIVYEPSGKIWIVNEASKEKLKNAWTRWKTGFTDNELAIKEMLSINKIRAHAEDMGASFENSLDQAGKDPVMAVDLLRQLCACSSANIGTDPILKENLVIIIDQADMLLPESDAARLSPQDRKSVGICAEWFSDPLFMNGNNAVVMIAESKTQINSKISKLPHVMSFEVPYPDEEARAHYISWFNQRQKDDRKIKLWSSQQDLARLTGGLSMHALRQLLVKASHLDTKIEPTDVIATVEKYIQSQLSEDVVEFKKPSHTLKEVVGFHKLKKFLKDEFIPRLNSTGVDALTGAIVCGSIGGGKTFIFEAVAAEADMLVLVLKNIRSQWFGQTDVLFERLRRLLISLNKVLIMVDEADTQFGNLNAETHSTERRLVGNIQGMMSAPELRGKVKWLLMTARIHLLSPDIRRPGRAGDLIIPILDPDDSEREEFVRWMIKNTIDPKTNADELTTEIMKLTTGYSAAAFASLRSEIKAKSITNKLDAKQTLELIADIIPADIKEARDYQQLQALMNCTRRSLIPDNLLPPGKSPEDARREWSKRITQLEIMGVR